MIVYCSVQHVSRLLSCIEDEVARCTGIVMLDGVSRSVRSITKVLGVEVLAEEVLMHGCRR